jgi:transposase-like protein
MSLMKKLRVTLKRTGNVVEFLKTMREGRFPVAHVPEAKQRCLVVWRL